MSSTLLWCCCFYPVCNFGKFINFGLGTVRIERVNDVSVSEESIMIMAADSIKWRKMPIRGRRKASINPLRPKNDLSQTSHSNINGVSVSEVMRIENKITPVKFY